MQAPLLSIKDLSINFIAQGYISAAIKNISLEVSTGEIVAIVGESGSGKSVTSLAILQLLPSPPAQYASGSITFIHAGQTTELLQASKQRMQSIRGNEISMIFQEPMTSLNPVHTCGRQVTEAIMTHQKIHGQAAKKQTLQLFEKVQLPNPAILYERYPHQLSGGQKQRVMIAMAMSCNPALLICDEPTTALDVTVQKTILTLIKDLQQQQNMGVIFITHDLGVVAEIADRVVVMYKGDIVEQGKASDIYLHPQHPYTKALLACRPGMHSKGKRLPVVSDFLKPIAMNDLQTVADPPTFSSTQTREDKVLLSAKNVQVWFPGKQTFFGKSQQVTKAVDGVSFDVFAGETLGLVGESGCGKTTLGRTLLRLIEPSDGQILFKGKDLAYATAKELRLLRKDVQIIFQDPYSSLNPRMSVGDAINEPLKVHGIGANDRERKERVLTLLQKVNLMPEHYSRYPHEFSGGQRQRIVIARALALNPSFIICDESVSALDVSVQAQVLNLLNDLKKDFGFTAIFISHDLSVVQYISDRIMVMHKGRIEEIGTAEQVYTNPTSEYTQRLIASIPKGITV